MTLHEAIIQVLREEKRALDLEKIADIINHKKLYSRKKDSQPLEAFQIRLRVINKSYRHYFNYENDKVGLAENDEPAVDKVGKYVEQPSQLLNIKGHDLKSQLVDEIFYSKIADVEKNIPGKSGLYSLYIINPQNLPDILKPHYRKQAHNIIYIGIAGKSLKSRLGAELWAKGHGTFFRSLGAALGFRPAKGSLIGKSNQKNYRFSKEDNSEIIHWLKENVKLGWLEIEDTHELNQLEKELIQYFTPLINLAHNPRKLPMISELRAECRRIATFE